MGHEVAHLVEAPRCKQKVLFPIVLLEFLLI